MMDDDAASTPESDSVVVGAADLVSLFSQSYAQAQVVRQQSLVARAMAKARVGDWLDLWYDDVKSAEDEEDRCWWPVQVDKIHLASQNGPSGSEDAGIVEAFDVHYRRRSRPKRRRRA